MTLLVASTFAAAPPSAGAGGCGGGADTTIGGNAGASTSIDGELSASNDSTRGGVRGVGGSPKSATVADEEEAETLDHARRAVTPR